MLLIESFRMRILGLDTAVYCTGVGVIETAGQRAWVVDYGCIRNPTGRILSQSLQHLFREIQDWLQRTEPDEIAIEGVFFCRNVKTAMSLGHARGAVITACSETAAPIHEYSPRRVKQAVCGFGGAGKDQITRMIVQLLALSQTPPADAADALAIALCHWHAGRGIRPAESRI